MKDELPRPDIDAISKMWNMVPDTQRKVRTERILRHFAPELEPCETGSTISGTKVGRLGFYQHTKEAFVLVSDGRVAYSKETDTLSRRAVAKGIDDATRLSMQALGITAPSRSDECAPAVGLSGDDVTRFQELAIVSGLIQDQGADPSKPLSSRWKNALRQSLDRAGQWLDRMAERDASIKSQRKHFEGDLQLLAKSRNLATVRDAAARLRAIRSEMELLINCEYADSQHGLGQFDVGGDNRDRQNDARRQDLVDAANRRWIEKKYGSASKRSARLDDLEERRSGVQLELNAAKRKLVQEAAPMVEKYRQFGFDGSLNNFKPGGSDVDFPTMQRQTVATIDYARSQPLPALRQMLDEL